MQSCYHNLPTVGGIDQHNGPEFRSTAFSAEGSTIAISFAPAYPAEVTLATADRTLTLTDERLTICDRFTYTGEARDVTEHIMTSRPPTVADSTVRLDGGYTLHAPGCSITDNARLYSNWKQDTLWRINFTQTSADEITLVFERSSK